MQRPCIFTLEYRGEKFQRHGTGISEDTTGLPRRS